MGNKIILTETNPILLLLYKLGVEDEGWGRRTTDQLIIVSAIHDLAKQLTDQDFRKQIQSIAGKAMVKIAENVTQESS